MRYLPVVFAILAVAGFCNAQEINYRFIIDAPGPDYRKMRGDIELAPQTEVVTTLNPVLTFQPAEISTALLVSIGEDQSQIHLTFRPDSVKPIMKYIEFNKAKAIRVEIGDYTLPIDIQKTLPWTTGVWLQARPTEKAKTILETLKKKD